MRSPVALLILWSVSSMAWGQPPRVTPPQPTANPEIGGKTLDAWMKDLADPDPSVREHACKMVGMLGPAGRKAVPLLLNQLRLPNDMSPLANAIVAIGLIVPEDPKQLKDSVALLNVLLDNGQGIIRFQSATSLGNLGPSAKVAIPKLSRLIRDQMSWEIRKATAYALGRIGRDEGNAPDMKALVALVDGIDDVAKEVRVESLQGLINLGPPPALVDQQKLKELLEKRIKVDKDKFVSIWVRVALMRCDPTTISEANMNYIAKHLKSSEQGIQSDAARALGALGPYAKAKVPDLIDTLNSRDAQTAAWAAWALGLIGPEAKAALPTLTTMTSSADPFLKQMATDAIKNINAAPKR